MYSFPSASQMYAPSPFTKTISGWAARFTDTTPPGMNRRLCLKICSDFERTVEGAAAVVPTPGLLELVRYAGATRPSSTLLRFRAVMTTAPWPAFRAVAEHLLHVSYPRT